MGGGGGDAVEGWREAGVHRRGILREDGTCPMHSSRAGQARGLHVILAVLGSILGIPFTHRHLLLPGKKKSVYTEHCYSVLALTVLPIFINMLSLHGEHRDERTAGQKGHLAIRWHTQQS